MHCKTIILFPNIVVLILKGFELIEENTLVLWSYDYSF